MNPGNVALLDWDFTLHERFTLFDWNSFLAANDALDPAIAKVLTESLADYNSGRMTYAELFEAAPTLYAEGLAGQSVEVVGRLSKSFVETDRPLVYEFTRPLMKLLLDLDIRPVVVSGAPTEVLGAYVDELGWSEMFGIDVDKRDDVYLSTLTSNPAIGPAKERIASMLASRYNITAAFGDSEADVPMLSAAKAKFVVSSPDLIRPATDVLHIRTTSPTSETISEVRELLIRKGLA